MPGRALKKKPPVVRLRRKRVEEENEENSVMDDSPERSMNSSKTKEKKLPNFHSILLAALSPIIEASQHKSNDRESLLEQIEAVYNGNDKKIFAEVLWRMMVVPFQVKEKVDTIERAISFFHALVNRISQQERAALSENLSQQLESNSECSVRENMSRKTILSHRILRLCEKYHDEDRPQTRMRIVQTILKICEACQSMDDLDSSLKKRIASVLLSRLKDKSHFVRCEAAKGLCYFQGGQGCPITLKMMEFIRIDPRPEVRKALILSIVLDSDDYGDFIDRVTDVHPEVRRACIHQIREISLESIPMTEKEKIVHCGLNDTSPAVRSETEKLIQHWFRVCNEDTLALLHEFDVYNHTKLCGKLLNILFEEANDDNWLKLSKDLFVDKMIPLDDLSEVKMFLWWYLFDRFSSLAYYGEQLIPGISDMYKYCRRLMQKLETELFDEEERYKIMGYFLKIILLIPVEEGGRLVLDKIARAVFKFQYKSVFHMKSLVSLVHKAHPGGCDEILLEIIRDMMDITTNSSNPVANKAPERNWEDEIRTAKLKLSTILHKKYKLVKEKEEHIKNTNFLEAHSIQEMIKEMEEEINVARKEIHDLETDCAMNKSTLEDEAEDVNSSSAGSTPEYSGEAMYFAFSAFHIHLKLVTKISQYLRNFLKAEVVKSIFREEEELRILVLQIMTQAGFFSIEDACTAMIVCLQGVLNEQGDVRSAALQCIFDLVLKYGLENFEDSKVKSVFSQIEDLTDEESVDKMLIQLLTSFFKSNDDGTIFHIAILGMLKLLIMGRLQAPKIVATLLSFWANSANEGTKIYHDIGTGLSMYVQQSSDKAETVSRALIPSVAKVINAPARSSLRKVDPEKLIGFVTMQTEQSRLSSLSKPHMPHQIIAFDILDEIRKRPLNPDNGIFVKALKGLSLQGISKESLHEMKTRLKSVIKDELRTVRQSLHAFGRYLDDLDPEVKELALMSDVGSSSESEEEAKNETVDMFQSMSTTAHTIINDPCSQASSSVAGNTLNTDTTNNTIRASSDEEDTIVGNEAGNVSSISNIPPPSPPCSYTRSTRSRRN